LLLHIFSVLLGSSFHMAFSVNHPFHAIPHQLQGKKFFFQIFVITLIFSYYYAYFFPSWVFLAFQIVQQTTFVLILFVGRPSIHLATSEETF
jgi:hypothetical protein